jgi:hypothetical protein
MDRYSDLGPEMVGTLADGGRAPHEKLDSALGQLYEITIALENLRDKIQPRDQLDDTPNEPKDRNPPSLRKVMEVAPDVLSDHISKSLGQINEIDALLFK